MSSRRTVREKAPPHKPSLRQKLFVLALALGAASAEAYLANVPRPINLPQDDVDAKTAAKADSERIAIGEPTAPEGDLLLSYSGEAGQVADLHFDYAIVDPSNVKLHPLLKPVQPVPAKIAYVSLPSAAGSSNATSASAGGDTCHTFVEVRRAKDSTPISAFNLFLLNGSGNNEQLRELRVWADGGTLSVEIHTDPPPSADVNQPPSDALPGCRKMLQVTPLEDNGSSVVDAPLAQLPLQLIVPEPKGQGQRDQQELSPANTFRIRLTPAVADSLMWHSPDDMFTAISLGDNSLAAKEVRVLPLHAQSGERLNISAVGKSPLVLDRLGFSLNTVRLSLAGRSWVKIDGKPLGFDFIRFLKENPVLSGVLVLINGWILKLVKESFFPRVDAKPDAAGPA